MKKLGLGLALTALLLPATQIVNARTICLNSSYGTDYVFKNVPALKPGVITLLKGVYDPGGINAPITGTAVVKSDGTVNYAIQIYSMTPMGGGNSWTNVIAGADKNLVGSGQWDNNGDFQSDGTISFTAKDCKLVNKF